MPDLATLEPVFRGTYLGVAALSVACSSEPEPLAPAPPSPRGTVVVTFNTGTSEGLGHDAPPDDGYGEAQALISDTYYGDGLSWQAAVDDVRAFFAALEPDIVVFQEIFYSGDCALIPAEAKAGFVCETYAPGDPTVAQIILGEGYQVACHLGKPDKCAAVRRAFGSLRGCDADLCLDFLDGAEVEDCGSGSRVGRGLVDLESGGTLTLVNVHGSSGIEQKDQDCRAAQFAQVFEDLGTGDGQPAANGERNLIMGDLNMDPHLSADFDEGAQKWNEHVGEGKRFHFITDVGPDAKPTYGGLFSIDHVVSDSLDGACWAAGVTDGHPAVSDMLYFDHKPIVCEVE